MKSGREILMFAAIMLGLFVVAIVTGVTYIGLGELKDVVCTNAGYVWQGEKCTESATNTSEVTLTSITQINVVQTAVGVALGLLTLVVIILIFAVVIKVTRTFNKATDGGDF